MKHSVISSRVEALQQRGFEPVFNLPLRPMTLEKDLIIDFSNAQLLSYPERPAFIILVAKTQNGRCVEFPFSKLANGKGEVAETLNRCASIDEFRAMMIGKLAIVSNIDDCEFMNSCGTLIKYKQYEFNFLA